MNLRHLPVAVLVLSLLAIGCQTPNHDDTKNGGTDDGWEFEESIPEDDRNPLLLVGIDGFKPSYLDTYEDQLPNLSELAEQGVRAESLKPVFPSHTFPNLYSIATGLYPENHGIISNTFYDPELDEVMSLSNNEAHRDADWWGGEPIWVTAEKQGLNAATFFWVGSEAPIQGVRPTHYVNYDSSIPHRQRTDQVVQWLADDDDPVDFATLYFAAVDGAGHAHGTDASELARTLGRVDDQIGRLLTGLRDAGVWPDINILIVSDHGMIDLDEDKVIFLDDIIDMSDVWVVDWTPVAMIRPDEGKADEVYDQLAAEADNYTVYRRHEIPQRLRLRNNERVPEIVVVADMPYTLTSRSYFRDRGMPTGGHGFDPAYDKMHGFFVGIGPDLPNRRRTETLKVVDIYPLMTYLMGIDPADHDGSLERIGADIFDD